MFPDLFIIKKQKNIPIKNTHKIFKIIAALFAFWIDKKFPKIKAKILPPSKDLKGKRLKIPTVKFIKAKIKMSLFLKENKKAMKNAMKFTKGPPSKIKTSLKKGIILCVGTIFIPAP